MVSSPPLPNQDQGKAGRPSKEQCQVNAETRDKAYEEKRAQNPPIRTSARVSQAKASKTGGKM